MKRYTSFKIGGPARFLIEPADDEDLRVILQEIQKYRLKFYVLGAGSNILASDRGFDGAVIRLNSLFFKQVSVRGNYVEAGAGVPLGAVLARTVEKGLSFFEYLWGIPGTVGGAVMMNAGVSVNRRMKSGVFLLKDKKYLSIGDCVERISLMDYSGRISVREASALNFTYRNSHIRSQIVLGAVCRLVNDAPKAIRKRLKDMQAYRTASQDYAYPSCGCFFRNPPGDSAGRLIDSCGLKGVRIGGACISSKHANFIINKGRACATDVIVLMKHVQKEVRKRCGVALKPEVTFIG